MAEGDRPFSLEVAVTAEGTVAINYRDGDVPMSADGWRHLTFTVPEALAFIRTLQAAAAAASLVAKKES